MRHCLSYLVVLTSIFYATASFLPSSFTSLKDTVRPWRIKVGDKLTTNFPKYFHEAGKSDIPNHYDRRFQHGIVSHEIKQDTQLHMVRAYLEFFQKQTMETWLAHGTLLGWWWNARVLPWDWDMDMQVTHPTLMRLATEFNNSVYEYTTADSDPAIQPPITRSYLLDINPAYIERVKGNGKNIIDARWIDMRNGMYIDITGVSEARPEKFPGVWSCKNEHNYTMMDLFPLRDSMFEGMIARVPYAYVRILTEEYQEKALVTTDYEGHRWDPTARLWTKKPLEELKQERLDRAEARRKKVAEKKAKQKEEMAAKKKEKADADAEKTKDEAG